MYSIKTRPPDARVHIKGKPEPLGWAPIDTCPIWVSEEEFKAGQVVFPTFVISKEGFFDQEFTPDPLPIKRRDFKAFPRPGYEPLQFKVENATPIALTRDPSFQGPAHWKNAVSLQVNSEPPGARIYVDGKCLGTAPVVIECPIENTQYETGVLRYGPIIAAHNECLPERQDLELRISPEWRYGTGVVGEYATVFLLTRDPNYKPPVIVQQQSQIVQGQSQPQGDLNINVTQQKDALDLLQQATQIGIMIKSLQPIR